jgi:hypothetical protein
MNEVMVAVAPGLVFNVGEIPVTGRARDGFVQMKHAGPYESNFSHVGELVCKEGSHVKRGDPICKVPLIYAHIAKLIFWDGTNFADPDNYGKGHSFMTYGEDYSPIDESLPFPGRTPYELAQRVMRQQDIVDRIDERRRSRPRDPLSNKWHNKGGYKETQWSYVEKFRYLCTMYELFPQEFPTLPNVEFDALKKDFYVNQPIVLTLPFRKA